MKIHLKKIFKLILILLIVAYGNLAQTEETKKDIRLFIIDDDVGMLRRAVFREGSYQAPWFPFTDPDGGLELIYALREPSIKVLGITCTFGCSTTDVCMASVKEILKLTGRTDVPLFRGANKPEDLGKPTDASKFIVETIMSNPGKVEILATAPLTNIATAIMLEPRIKENWKALHFATGEFMGALGELSDGAWFSKLTGYQDLNINVDYKAVRYMLQNGGNFIIYPNEIMDDAVISEKARNELKKANTALSNWVAKEIWHSTFAGRIAKLGGMPLHGVIPLAVAIEPEIAFPPLELRVDLEHKKRTGYFFTISNDQTMPSRQVYIKLEDPKRVEEQVIKRCQ